MLVQSCSGTACTIPSAAVCGSASTSCRSFTGAHGTPIAPSRSNHSAVGRSAMSAAICGSNSALCATRSPLVRNRASAAHSGCPSSPAYFANSRSLAAATTTSPSAVSKAWNTTTFGFPLRCRGGGLPVAWKFAQCAVSHPSAVSNNDVSTRPPRPVSVRRSSAAITPSAAQTPEPRSSTCIPTRVGGPSSVPFCENMPA